MEKETESVSFLLWGTDNFSTGSRCMGLLFRGFPAQMACKGNGSLRCNQLDFQLRPGLFCPPCFPKREFPYHLLFPSGVKAHFAYRYLFRSCGEPTWPSASSVLLALSTPSSASTKPKERPSKKSKASSTAASPLGNLPASNRLSLRRCTVFRISRLRGQSLLVRLPVRRSPLMSKSQIQPRGFEY